MENPCPRAHRPTVVAAVLLTVAAAVTACASFSSDGGAPAPFVSPDASPGGDETAPPSPDGAFEERDASGEGGDAAADAGCPALPTAAVSLQCAGAPCPAPASICCSNPDASGPSMICDPGGVGCAIAAARRRRACGSRLHCQSGQGHCCASALVLTATDQCPILGQAEDGEGWGSGCEPVACAPAYEVCAAGDSCGGGSTCVPVRVVTDGLPIIIGVCRRL